MKANPHVQQTSPVSDTLQCRLCGDSGLQMLFITNGCLLVRCRQCDLLQIADKISEEQIRSIYSSEYFRHEKYHDDETLRRENKRRLRLVQNFVKEQESKILEAGCGTGDFLSIAKHTYDCSGFDLSIHAVEIARRANAEIADNIWRSDLSGVELPESYFDAVCLWDVIEHLWHFKPMCKKLLGCLKPGGFLFLSTPDSRSLMARTLGRFWPLMTPPEHASFFSRISLKHLFEDHLNSFVVYSSAKGKWINLRFAVRKIRKVTNTDGAEWFFKFWQRLLPARLSVYIPSHDIRYTVIQKTADGVE